MRQFKIGDHVQCIDNDNSRLPLKVGVIYKVSDVLVTHDEDLVMVETNSTKIDMWIQTMRFVNVSVECKTSQDTFSQLCDRIKDLHVQKGTTYTKNVVEELPVDMWLSQIVIKATRAKYAVRDAKRVDELFDTAVYCLMTLEKMARQGVNLTPIMGVSDTMAETNPGVDVI